MLQREKKQRLCDILAWLHVQVAGKWEVVDDNPDLTFMKQMVRWPNPIYWLTFRVCRSWMIAFLPCFKHPVAYWPITVSQRQQAPSKGWKCPSDQHVRAARENDKSEAAFSYLLRLQEASFHARATRQKITRMIWVILGWRDDYPLGGITTKSKCGLRLHEQSLFRSLGYFKTDKSTAERRRVIGCKRRFQMHITYLMQGMTGMDPTVFSSSQKQEVLESRYDWKRGTLNLHPAILLAILDIRAWEMNFGSNNLLKGHKHMIKALQGANEAPRSPCALSSIIKLVDRREVSDGSHLTPV